MSLRIKILSQWAIAVGLLFSASSFACGDYCDSGWAGVYETGGYDFYQSAYDVYQSTLEVDITTTTYMPVYDTSSYGGGCGSLLSTCGGGYDNPTINNPYTTPYGSGPGTPGDIGLIPRDPNNPLDPFNPLINPFNPGTPGGPGLGTVDPMNPGGNPIVPIAVGGPMPGGPGIISRDPAVLPPTVPPMPLPLPIAMNPPFPPYTGTLPTNPYQPPVVNPPNPTPVTPVGVGTSTLPNTGTVTRDPNTPYVPPAPPPYGGCDNVVVMCPTGPVVRPTGTTGSTPVISTLMPGNTVPTVSNPSVSPSTQTSGTPVNRNQIPRGARRTH